MDKTNDITENKQGLEFWENEVIYFEKAQEGLKLSFSLVSSMLKTARDKVIELTPEREDIVS